MRWLKVRRPQVPTFAVVGVVVVFAFGYMAWSLWERDRTLDTQGVETTARVVEVGRRIQVEFQTADGRRVRTLVAPGGEVSGARPGVGEQIPIVYDPEDPEGQVRDVRAPEGNRTAYLLGGAACFGAVAVPVALLARRRKKK
ncbi:DUF3592 domain-containing protein [Phytohabitans suffuscus]|uniref:DUF3592 domain-containing protein n=1 Tax=Phytohabitans suffuscus TaxID=624315 RepID=A0A6F8YA88_9ACTN|nr:hypothetical protein Psuf_003290 [Phytohabitans suffuscus]